MSDDDTLILTAPGPATLVITAEETGFLGFAATGLPGTNGRDAAGLIPLPYSKSGPMNLSTGPQRFYLDYDVVLTRGHASLGTPPLGSDFVLRFNLDGSPFAFLTIPDGAHDIVFDWGSLPIAAGSYLSVDRTAVGSIFPGADLTAVLWMKALV